MLLELLLASPALLCGGVVLKRVAAPKIVGGLSRVSEKLAFSLPGASETELFNGAPKPSGILAGMICARLLTDEFKPVGNQVDFKGFSVVWSDAPVHGKGRTRYLGHPALPKACAETGRPSYWKTSYAREEFTHANIEINDFLDRTLPKTRSVDVTGFDVIFSDQENQQMLEALEKAFALYEGRVAAQKAAENQMKAVAAIEELFKPVPVTTAIEEKSSVKKVKPTKEELLGPIVLEEKNG